MRPDESTALLASIISGAPFDVGDLVAIGAVRLLREAAEHDVVPLIADRLLRPDRVHDLPVDLLSALRDQAYAAAVVDLVRDAEIRRFFSAASGSGIGALLVKGSALAYTHYPRPDLRARVDTDLLIARSDVERAHALLTERLGYEVVGRVSNDLTNPQRTYSTRLPLATHIFDVHWEIASPRAFASMPTYEELSAAAVPIPVLGPAARGPSQVHALLIACVHRVAHHLDAADLKWLYDIHLLASRFDAQQWDAFVAEANARRVAAVCQRGLQLAVERFGTSVPADILDGSRLSAGLSSETTAEYLTPSSQFERMVHDARHLTWTARLQLLRAHLFPGEAYMRGTYAPSSRAPLAVLYAIRAARGAAGWFTRNRAS